MKIGDRCFVHGYIDEIRKDTVIIKNKGGYFGTDPGEVIVVNNTAHPNWIPVTERLPEEGEIVLVSDGIDCAVAFWRSDADAWDDPLHGWLDSFGFDVKAWMSLPPVYQGE